MLWIVSNIFRQDIDTLRDKIRPDHLAYMKKRGEDVLILSGPMQSDDATDVSGSLFIVNTKDKDEAQAFSENEPYTKAGLYKSTTLTRMRKGQWHPELLKE